MEQVFDDYMSKLIDDTEAMVRLCKLDFTPEEAQMVIDGWNS